MENLNKMVEQMIQNQEEMIQNQKEFKESQANMNRSIDILKIMQEQQCKDIESIKNIILKYEEEEESQIKVVK